MSNGERRVVCSENGERGERRVLERLVTRETYLFAWAKTDQINYPGSYSRGSGGQGWPGRDGSRTRAPRPAPRVEIRASCSAPRRAPGLARSSCEPGLAWRPCSSRLWDASRTCHFPYATL